MAQAQISGQLDDGRVQRQRVGVQAQYYLPQGRRRLFYAAASLDQLTRPELPDLLLLGGDNGLRGYPLRFQGGTSSALLTLEHRIFTDWYPFRLVRFGTAVFFDAGRTWGRNFNGTEPYGTLKDVGFGLRFGNVRSGLGNVLHVDLSYSLDARGVCATQSLGNDQIKRTADHRFARVAEHLLGRLIDKGDAAMLVDDDECKVSRLGEAGYGALHRRIILAMHRRCLRGV